MGYDAIVTTKDNPYNPFEQPEEWLDYDHAMGHNTMEYIDRVTYSSPELPPVEQEAAYDDAIDRIIENDIFDMYEIVYDKRNN